MVQSRRVRTYRSHLADIEERVTNETVGLLVIALCLFDLVVAMFVAVPGWLPGMFAILPLTFCTRNILCSIRAANTAQHEDAGAKE
jgi:nitrate reductase NapE component